MAADAPAVDDGDADTSVATLANGVRVVVIRQPQGMIASVSVFVRTGSAHERRPDNGISHVVEHMVFKGTASRDARRINVDAEQLGAEVNAHTDKDHSAFHMRGLAGDAGSFVRMLGDILLGATFPADELEREREVLLQEFTEDEEDPISVAFRLFDRASFGAHAAAQPVIGNRRNIERFARDDLLRYMRRQYTGTNVVVGVAGGVDPAAIVADAEAAFGALPAGEPNLVPPADWIGGLRSRRLAGTSQSHLVLGFPLPALRDDAPSSMLAAALFGEGMSSPLMDELRERRGLLYYAACSADVLDCCGQFVVEASTAPDKLDEALGEVLRLLMVQAAGVSAQDLERARNQVKVRRLRQLERPSRRLEQAALDLPVLGRLRPQAQWASRLAALDAEQMRQGFARMLAAGASVAVTGELGRGAGERLRGIVAARLG